MRIFPSPSLPVGWEKNPLTLAPTNGKGKEKKVKSGRKNHLLHKNVVVGSFLS
jgi:hypothetical protein|tara:strand:- start:395 stop:553 length:159 start_codon:yes stop_codon:yes gene_type:complete